MFLTGIERWTSTDTLLMGALEVYERELLCPCGCGFTRDQAWDDDADGWFEGYSAYCYARAAQESYEAEHSGEAREPGELVGVRDTREI